MKHTKKRVAALLLTLAMVLSLMPMAFAADEYPEGMPAEDDASYAAVKSAYDNGIMTGENGQMNLEGTILRSTVSKMVVTTFAAKGEADLSGYPDVDSEAWYAAWMAKANQMGIMTGSSGKMNPSSEVTLAEVAAMLVRALGLSVDKDAAIEGVNAWAAPYIKALLDAGYISSEDVVGAHQPMSRGAFAEVIYKVSGQGNYVSEGEITEDVDGNIIITSSNVSLKGITVKGNVIIADGVDAGSITLDNVKVEGCVVVRGAGVKMANGTTAESTVVAATGDTVTVIADAASNAGNVTVVGTNGKAAANVNVDAPASNVAISSDANNVVIGDAKQVITADGVKTTITGTVDDVVVPDGAAPEITNNGTIKNVTSNEDVAISGTGTVENKTGSGTVTDGSGNEVGGSDEPADIVIPDLGGITIPPSVSTPGEAPEEAEDPSQTEVDKTPIVTGGALTDEHQTHTFVADSTKDKAATCTEAGYTYKACDCGAVERTPTDMVAHTEESDGDTEYAKAATVVEGNCKGAGYASYSCTVCHAANVKVVKGSSDAGEGKLDKKAHTEGTVYATKDVEGTQKHFTKCAVCSEEFGDGEACAAAEEPKYTFTGTQHSTTCATCKAAITEGHDENTSVDAVAPTCTEAGKATTTSCSVCGYTKPAAVVPATGHTWAKDTDRNDHVDATETTRGLEWQKCTVEGCGATRSIQTPVLSAGGNDGDDDSQAHQHTAGSKWGKDADQHWHICDGNEADCGTQKFGATAHTWGSNAQSPNGACTAGCGQTHTCDNSNDTTTPCSKCGYKTEAASTPAPNQG